LEAEVGVEVEPEAVDEAEVSEKEAAE